MQRIEKPAGTVNGQDEWRIELHPKSWTSEATKGVQFTPLCIYLKSLFEASLVKGIFCIVE